MKPLLFWQEILLLSQSYYETLKYNFSQEIMLLGSNIFQSVLWIARKVLRKPNARNLAFFGVLKIVYKN